MLHIARMTTRHFTFEAAGATEDEARKALLAGWRRHLRQCMEGRSSRDCSDIRASLRMSMNELDDWYGISVTAFEPGDFYRDGSKF